MTPTPTPASSAQPLFQWLPLKAQPFLGLYRVTDDAPASYVQRSPWSGKSCFARPTSCRGSKATQFLPATTIQALKQMCWRVEWSSVECLSPVQGLQEAQKDGICGLRNTVTSLVPWIPLTQRKPGSWGCSSMSQYLPSRRNALDSILSAGWGRRTQKEPEVGHGGAHLYCEHLAGRGRMVPGSRPPLSQKKM